MTKLKELVLKNGSAAELEIINKYEQLEKEYNIKEGEAFNIIMSHCDKVITKDSFNYPRLWIKNKESEFLGTKISEEEYEILKRVLNG